MIGIRGPCLPLDQRLRSYEEVLRLRRQGLSYSKIIEEIYRLSGVRLYHAIISHWVRGRHQPLGRVNEFDASPSPTLAYIIGARFGDAYFYKHCRAHVFSLGVVDYEFAARTGRSLADLLGRRTPYKPRWDKRNQRWRVRACSVLLYEFLQRPVGKLKFHIEHCRDCVAAFLKGIFDSEGSIKGRTLTVYNTNIRLLLYVQDLLQRYFRVKTTGPHGDKREGRRFYNPRRGKIYRRKKQCYDLYIRVNGLSRFHKHIGFTIRRKQQRLVEAIQKWPPSPSNFAKYHSDGFFHRIRV